MRVANYASKKNNILGCECAANGIKICANVSPPGLASLGLFDSKVAPGWDSQRGGGTRGSPRGEAPGKFLMVYGAKIATFYAAAASAPAASSSGRSGCSRAHSTAIKPILEHDDAANVRCDIMRVVIFQWCERNLELPVFNKRAPPGKNPCRQVRWTASNDGLFASPRRI